MRITESQLHRIVREEMQKLTEGPGDGDLTPVSDRDALVRVHEVLMNIDYESYETMDRGIRKAISICNMRGVFSK